jgi:hypothetical protein
MIVICPHCGKELRIKNIMKRRLTPWNKLNGRVKSKRIQATEKWRDKENDKSLLLAHNHGQTYTPDEIDYLKLHYLEYTRDKLALDLGRSKFAIEGVLYRLKLNDKREKVGICASPDKRFINIPLAKRK